MPFPELFTVVVYRSESAPAIEVIFMVDVVVYVVLYIVFAISSSRAYFDFPDQASNVITNAGPACACGFVFGCGYSIVI